MSAEKTFPPKTITSWINGRTVGTATLIAELREWADYFESDESAEDFADDFDEGDQ